ncbi:MAG TPA: 30S ribosomal protein S12 methylthiotransferase RimO [Candidatus Polarisedimenticolia bacterium]|jgi:ribosomal protein S12 methylthiotransferase|nr:30S ribosomal protein S12 methylthiotransferase RimO [Candidatus Polarisedimenticolia bacterium]
MPVPAPVRVGFVSLGCPKNLVDSEVMLGSLRGSGCELSADPADSDVIVVNTCGFIESAKRESIDTILEMAEHRKKGRCRRLVVAGCLVQRYHRELRDEIPEIDAFVGLDELDKIVQAVRGDLASAASDPAAAISGMARALYDHRAARVLATRPHLAYLKISEGCDHVCSFCAIPSMRGRMRSRSVASLRLEAEALARRGVKELILIAQDSTDYGADLGDGADLAGLLRTLDAVPGIEWIRIHYAYPNRVSDALLHAMAASPKVCRYLDIPLQHADPAILRSMRRGGGGAAHLRLIRKIRRILPGCALRTTFIVGFPGETRHSFRMLCDFVREARFEHAGVFAYSHEEGTAAFSRRDDVSAALKSRRRDRLMEIQAAIALEHNRARIGRLLPVRIDGLETETRMLLTGRTEFQSPDVDGRVLITDGVSAPGTLAPVRILEAHPYDLVGHIERT